ncbi:MAG: hypothetical protein Q7S34_03035 [bacterium]|nr:hypothetical protein [bacterium]
MRSIDRRTTPNERRTTQNVNEDVDRRITQNKHAELRRKNAKAFLLRCQR